MYSWWQRRKRDADLDRELRSHLEAEAAEQQQAGLAPRDAIDAARRALGNTTLIREEVREMDGWTRVEQFLQDLRYTFRGMRNNPGFTTVALLSLALGIGATTAVFSVLNAVVLRPLPVAEPDRLAILQAELRGRRFVLFNPLFEELRRTQQSLTGMFAISDEPYMKAAFGQSAPVYVRGSLVSGNYFEVLGLTPVLGRLLTAEDDSLSAQTCVAVLSHSFWSTMFHRDPGVLGHQVFVREKSCTVVGVAPESFVSHMAGYSPDLWLPLRPLTDPKLLASPSMGFFSGVMGRLRPGITPGQAEAELTGLYQRMHAASEVSPIPGQAPTNPADYHLRIMPGAQGLDALRRQFGQPLNLALCVVVVVLLIAATNVANLLLARGTARRTELATRAALGAGRARLIRLLAMEGSALAVLGGLAGVLLARLATPLLAKAISISYMPLALDATPDIRVFGIAAASTVFAALLAGIFPALRLSGDGLQLGMAEQGRVSGSRSSQRMTRTLVAAQLALSLLLISAAGLLLRTMIRVMGVDPGFDSSHVLLLDIRDTAPAARYGDSDTPEQVARRTAQYRALDQSLNTIPGVQSASLSWLGLFGGNYVGLNLTDVDHPENRQFTLTDYVSPHYFETVGMKVLRGRSFTDEDREESLPVAVVNEAFARDRIRDGREAIGRRFIMTYGKDQRAFTIVGVLHDAKYNDVRERKHEPMMWIPLAQTPYKITSVFVRVQPGSDESVLRGARAALAASSRHLMIRRITTLQSQVDRATWRERLLMNLAMGFGGIALLLTAVGLYGTLAYSVARRTREIGVRLALGAQRTSVLGLVLGESLMVVLAGVLLGVPLSIAAGYLIRAFLFGVRPWDAAALVGAIITLTAVAIVASLVPARRASRIEPVVALRQD